MTSSYKTNTDQFEGFAKWSNNSKVALCVFIIGLMSLVERCARNSMTSETMEVQEIVGSTRNNVMRDASFHTIKPFSLLAPRTYETI